MAQTETTAAVNAPVPDPTSDGVAVASGEFHERGECHSPAHEALARRCCCSACGLMALLTTRSSTGWKKFLTTNRPTFDQY
jgi:hypothetical protein